MDKISVIGLDLAKNVFQAHGANAQGKKVLSRRLKRAEVLEFFATLPRCRVGMEACGGAHEWAGRIEAFGHEVKLMAPQYVKTYVQRNKIDAWDAAPICDAAGRESVGRVTATDHAGRSKVRRTFGSPVLACPALDLERLLANRVRTTCNYKVA